MSLFRLPLLPLLLLSLLSFTSAQTISIDVLTKLDQPRSFQTESIIARMMKTQEEKIESGVMTQFESHCIAVNTVDLLGDENASRFTQITARALEGVEPSLDDQKFISEISNRYYTYMMLIANQCAVEQERMERQKNAPQESEKMSPSANESPKNSDKEEEERKE